MGTAGNNDVDIAQLGGELELTGELLEVGHDDHLVNTEGEQAVDRRLDVGEEVLGDADVSG